MLAALPVRFRNDEFNLSVHRRGSFCKQPEHALARGAPTSFVSGEEEAKAGRVPVRSAIPSIPPSVAALGSRWDPGVRVPSSVSRADAGNGL